MAFLLLTSGTTALCQQSYLYSPRPVTPGENVQKGDGILVQDVRIQKGDTLYGLSRTSSGRGSYYPQILLFNDIKNPDLIYAGDTIKVPVAPDRPRARKDNTGAGTAPGRPASSRRHKASARPAPLVQQAKAVSKPSAPADAATGQKLFERAVSAYRRDDCRSSLELFDRFLAANPSSPLAADATLYKAECYLKQSGQ
jgi:TolA-binding protein